MSKRIAVILSGCGVYDGSEIYEATLTLLRLDQAGAKVQCFAPDIPQLHVIDHSTGEELDNDSRNVLTESARLARGNINPLKEAKAEDFDAVIVPGGFGAAKNLSDFATAGEKMQLQDDFKKFTQAMRQANKPIGLMCIAPVMAVAICGEGSLCTIGEDTETAAAINKMGGQHQNCAVDDIVVDSRNKLITTPAYMSASGIAEAAIGINKLVDKVLSMS